MANALSFISLPDGWQAASACKAYRACWRRRCRGILRVARQRVGRFSHVEHVTALPGGGAIVPHYGADLLETYSPEGVQAATCIPGQPCVATDDEWDSGNLRCPSAMALRGDGTAWVILKDDGEVACVRLGAVINEPIMKIKYSEDDHECSPVDLALAGSNRLLILCCGEGHISKELGRVQVLDNQTGARLYTFGTTGENWQDELRGPSCLAVHEQYCFIADTHNQAIKLFNWRDGTLVRAFGKNQDHSWAVKEHLVQVTYETGYSKLTPYYSRGRILNTYEDMFRKGDGPGEFNTPCGVAVRDGKLYVSELEGRRIQVFRLPDDMSGSDLELLQTIPSPDGWPLSGLCVDDGGRLWCVGPGSAWFPTPDGLNERRDVFPRPRPYGWWSYLHIFEPVFK